MKIGIVTMHDALNAGAILQAYALQTCLEGMGHQIEFIDIERQYKFNWRNYIAKSPQAMWHKWIDSYNLEFYRRDRDWNKCLHKSKVHYRTYKQLQENPPEYDAYIVGSDQVWNFLRELSPLHLLDFVPKDKKRISYAASMGQCNIPKHLHSELKRHLTKFHAISLREDSGVDFVNRLMEANVACKTIDPTLLIDQQYYDKICETPTMQKPFVVSYILSQLDQQQCHNLTEWAKQQHKLFINLRNPSTCIRIPNIRNVVVTPYLWLGYIKKSDFVISGSFHATVFSLIYHKPFFVMLPKELKVEGGNVRINSLLEPLGLQHRILYDDDVSTMNSVANQGIDWTAVDTYLSEQRELSINYLQSSLL